ncbi:hypothetical protein ACWKSP_21915 [Micromonosporaceae bacterium Da 78-11]
MVRDDYHFRPDATNTEYRQVDYHDRYLTVVGLPLGVLLLIVLPALAALAARSGMKHLRSRHRPPEPAVSSTVTSNGT